ncbi:MAG: peptidylprolyl isomerase [Tissierellia bacterium]|nr:peptidylprolyl isomerase [Tissierellia bacterium]
MADEKILAIVDGKEITRDEVEMFIDLMGPQGIQFRSPEGINRIADEMVNQELMYLDAVKKGLDKEERYLEEVERSKESILKQFAIASLFKGIEISDEDVKEYYDSHKENFKKPVSMTASHILVDSEEKAEEIKKEIEDGVKTFEEAAKEYSSCPSKDGGGALGTFQQGQMVPEFELVALTQELNKVSIPVQTQFGYHLILVTDRTEEDYAELDEVKDQIKQQLNALKQQEVYLNKVSEIAEDYKIEKFY